MEGMYSLIGTAAVAGIVGSIGFEAALETAVYCMSRKRFNENMKENSQMWLPGMTPKFPSPMEYFRNNYGAKK